MAAGAIARSVPAVDAAAQAQATAAAATRAAREAGGNV